MPDRNTPLSGNTPDPDDFPERVLAAMKRGEYETHPDGSSTVCGHRFDRHGNPMVKTDGCPNCGKGKGWVDGLEHVAAANSGVNLDGPCSRRCALQLDHAARIAGDQILREANDV